MCNTWIIPFQLLFTLHRFFLLFFSLILVLCVPCISCCVRKIFFSFPYSSLSCGRLWFGITLETSKYHCTTSSMNGEMNELIWLMLFPVPCYPFHASTERILIANCSPKSVEFFVSLFFSSFFFFHFLFPSSPWNGWRLAIDHVQWTLIKWNASYSLQKFFDFLSQLIFISHCLPLRLCLDSKSLWIIMPNLSIFYCYSALWSLYARNIFTMRSAQIRGLSQEVIERKNKNKPKIIIIDMKMSLTFHKYRWNNNKKKIPFEVAL